MYCNVQFDNLQFTIYVQFSDLTIYSPPLGGGETFSRQKASPRVVWRGSERGSSAATPLPSKGRGKGVGWNVSHKKLAKELEPEYGSRFGERQLKFCRQFYRTYPIGNTLRS